MRRTVVLVAVLALAMSSVPGSGFHDPGVPMIDEVSSPGAHWVAWRFVMSSSAIMSYEVEIEGGEEARQAALAEWIIGDDGFSFTVLGLSNPGNGGTHVQTIATGVLVDEPGQPMGVEHGVAVVHRLAAGKYTVVLAWDGADLGVGRLFGDGAMKVLGRTDGSEAVWSPQRSFDGIANADVEGSGATVAGSVTTTVSGNLFGAFLKFPGRGVEVMSYTGPAAAGLAVDEFVFVDSNGPVAAAAALPFFIFNGTPAGRYDFFVLGGVHQEGGVTLFTADVQIPAG